MTDAVPSPALWKRSVAGSSMSLCRTMNRPAVVRRRRIVVAVVLLLGAAVLSLALRQHPGEPSVLLVVAGVGGGLGAGAFVVRAVASRRRPLAGPQPAPGGQRQHDRAAARGRFPARRVDRPGDPGGRRAHHPVAALHRSRIVAAHSGHRAAGRHRRGVVLPRRAVHRAGPAPPVADLHGRSTAATLASSQTRCSRSPPSFSARSARSERRATGGVLAPILTHFVWTPGRATGVAAAVRSVTLSCQ